MRRADARASLFFGSFSSSQKVRKVANVMFQTSQPQKGVSSDVLISSSPPCLRGEAQALRVASPTLPLRLRSGLTERWRGRWGSRDAPCLRRGSGSRAFLYSFLPFECNIHSFAILLGLANHLAVMVKQDGAVYETVNITRGLIP